MSFKCSFSFNNILQTKINDKVYLRLERIGFAIARLYFVDEDHTETKIPAGLTVNHVNYDNVTVAPIKGHQFYALAYSDSYAIKLNGVDIIEIANQRQWSIHASKERKIETIYN